MPGHYTFHGGSTLLQPLADSIGLRVDQFSEQKNRVPMTVRLTNPVEKSSDGSVVPWFQWNSSQLQACLGRLDSVKHLLADGIGCYLILRFVPIKYVHK
uniref:Uncharacterized protein n=1 Tax=Romanomermis culicivorax TaxID=13658 RepID=A0A915IUJ8_ROMCU